MPAFRMGFIDLVAQVLKWQVRFNGNGLLLCAHPDCNRPIQDNLVIVPADAEFNVGELLDVISLHVRDEHRDTEIGTALANALRY